MHPLRRLVRLALPLVVVPLLADDRQPAGAVPDDQPVDRSAARAFRFRSIGPASMGGRIDDIAVSESDPNIIYLGYAIGGVFKSENNGTTFEPVFDTYGDGVDRRHRHPSDATRTSSTSAPARRTTARPRRSATASTRRPTAARRSRNIGLKETQTIARIVIDPKNPETVYVASPGHLFGPNPERGVYKTTDGGKTWNKVKFIDEDTGFTDIAIDPVEHQHPVRGELPAAAQRLLLQRRRSGQRDLEDARTPGKTWTKLTGNGLPPGTYGRIALDVSRSNPERRLRADRSRRGRHADAGRGVDPAASTEATPPARRRAVGGCGGRCAAAQLAAAHAGGRGAAAGGGGRGGYNWCNNGGPGRSARRRGGSRGRRLRRSIPRAAAASSAPRTRATSWTHVSNCNARPMYFSQLRVDPTERQGVYVAGLPIAKSLDGGKTFATLDEAGGQRRVRATSISTRSGSIRRTRSTS